MANYANQIDRDPPMASDGNSLLDYLAYLKEQINFLFHNWTKTARDAKAAVDAIVSAGTIKRLTTNTVLFSNNIAYGRARVPAASLVSNNGTQVGTSGIYMYKIKLTSSATNMMSTPVERPIEVCSLYSNALQESIPASMRAEGSSGAWREHYITFYYPASTLSGTFCVDYIVTLTTP